MAQKEQDDSKILDLFHEKLAWHM